MTDYKEDFHELQSDGTYKKVWRGNVRDLNGAWFPRSRKHRYMMVFDDSLNVKWQEQPYPKGDNNEYELKIPDKDQISFFDII